VLTGPEEARTDGPAVLCPVCLWPDQSSARCQTCGWELIGDYVAGAATPADHRAMAGRLAAAEQRHDVRAAVRAVSVGGDDPARLTWLAGCARGGAPSDSQLRRISAEVTAQNARLPAELPSVGYAMIRLLARETDGLVFVEIGPEAISGSVLVADQLGVPRLRPAGGDLLWSGLLAGLPAEIDLARFRLAGGIGAAASGRDSGPAGHSALREAVGDAAARALAVIMKAATAAAPGARPESWPGRGSAIAPPRAPRLDVILVRRTIGWPVLDALARQAWVQVRPIMEIYQAMTTGSLAGLVDQIASRTPLRYAYDLILLQVNAHNGVVRVQPRELFAAGTVPRPGQPPAAAVTVAPPPHAADIVELPVVARRGDRDVQWPLVDSYFINGTDSQPTQLRISLPGPGQLRQTATPALVRPPAAGSSWPTLLRRLPSRLGPVPALDLAFLVELGGYDDAAVIRRMRLVREVIGALRDAAPESTAQVAVIGYRDHYGRYKFRARAEHSQLIIQRQLNQIPAALGIVGSHELWARVAVHDDYAAPLECALRKLAEDGLAWRPGARRVVLIVGSRAPHPHMPDVQGSLVQTCPDGSDWRRYLTMIQRDAPVRFLVVTDDPPPYEEPRRYISQAWREFSAESIFPIGTVSLAPLVQAIGLAPDNGGTRLGLAVSASPSSGYLEREAASGRGA
jgi:hypothetical protein